MALDKSFLEQNVESPLSSVLTWIALTDFNRLQFAAVLSVSSETPSKLSFLTKNELIRKALQHLALDTLSFLSEAFQKVMFKVFNKTR